MNATTIGLRRVDLDSRVELLRDLVRRSDERWQEPAASLSEVLVDPLESAGWLDGIEHVYVVPHGILNYLPFAALLQREAGLATLLLDRYMLAYLPSAAALFAHTSESPAADSLLVIAPQRSRLAHAQSEARALHAMFEPESALLVGDQATESRFKSMAGDFRIVHLATHGYFNKLNPLFSGLQLEPDKHNDGLLEVHEILGLQLDAELVTLSACETALGSGYFAEVPAGDEFVGLTRAFLSVGSETVMATLWEVDDFSSVQLMTQFYERFNDGEAGHTKAAALTAAQRDLRAIAGFEHPYYWAPFILVGRLDPAPGDKLQASEVSL